MVFVGFVSAVQRRKQMGQRSDDVFLSYVSRITGVDTQAILNAREPDQDLMDLMQSMVVNLDVDAPQPRGCRLTDINRRGLGPVEGPAEPIREIIHVGAVSGTLDGRDQQSPVPRCYDDEIVRPTPSARFQKYLTCDPARFGIIKAFYEPDADSSFSSSVGFLSTIADAAPIVWRYSQAAPDEHSRCKPCGKLLLLPANSHAEKIARSRNIADNMHLLRCHLRTLKKETEQSFLEGIRERSPRCQWAFCREPLDQLDRALIEGHIGSHLQKNRQTCLWSTCRQVHDSLGALRDHLWTSHGLPSVHPPPGAPAYCHDCREYFTEYADWSEQSNSVNVILPTMCNTDHVRRTCKAIAPTYKTSADRRRAGNTTSAVTDETPNYAGPLEHSREQHRHCGNDIMTCLPSNSTTELVSRGGTKRSWASFEADFQNPALSRAVTALGTGSNTPGQAAQFAPLHAKPVDSARIEAYR